MKASERSVSAKVGPGGGIFDCNDLAARRAIAPAGMIYLFAFYLLLYKFLGISYGLLIELSPSRVFMQTFPRPSCRVRSYQLLLLDKIGGMHDYDPLVPIVMIT